MSSTLSKSHFSRHPKTTGDLLLADDPQEYEYAEYEYEPDDDHLSESAAVERYKTAKALHPDAIINLERLPCGHYSVSIHKADWQKQQFYKRTYNSLLRRALDRIFGALESTPPK